LFPEEKKTSSMNNELSLRKGLVLGETYVLNLFAIISISCFFPYRLATYH
jgi:hypothetical protein